MPGPFGHQAYVKYGAAPLRLPMGAIQGTVLAIPSEADEPMRGVVRAAGTIGKPTGAFTPRALQPRVGGRARAAQLGRHIGDPMAGQDALDQQRSAGERQTRVSVGHEDLRGVDGIRHLHNTLGVLIPSSRICQQRCG